MLNSSTWTTPSGFWVSFLFLELAFFFLVEQWCIYQLNHKEWNSYRKYGFCQLKKVKRIWGRRKNTVYTFHFPLPIKVFVGLQSAHFFSMCFIHAEESQEKSVVATETKTARGKTQFIYCRILLRIKFCSLRNTDWEKVKTVRVRCLFSLLCF